MAHDREGARAKALGGGVAAHRGEVVHAALRRLPTVAEVQLPVAHDENQLLFTGVFAFPVSPLHCRYSAVMARLALEYGNYCKCSSHSSRRKHDER